MFCVRSLHVAMLKIDEFRENRRSKSRVVLIEVNKIVRGRVKRRNAFVESMFCVTECTVGNLAVLVLVRGYYGKSENCIISSHAYILTSLTCIFMSDWSALHG